MPAEEQAAVDDAMSSVGSLVDKGQRTFSKSDNSLVLEDVVSSGRVKEPGIQTVVFLVHRYVLLVICCGVSC